MHDRESLNPLIRPWSGPFGGVPPWDAAQPDRFGPAFEAALAEQRGEIDAITANPDPPTFANTVVALERVGRTLDRVTRMFDVLRENISTPEIQAIDREWQPKLAEADDALVFNPALFARIDAVFRSRASAGLTAEETRLVEKMHEQFVRRGARLDAGGKAELGTINQQLATAFTDFRAKVLAEEDTWTTVAREADLDGLPDSFIGAARSLAEERGLAGQWIILNTRSSVDPVLAFARSRRLREEVWRRFKNRGDNGNDNDTNALIARIVRLRARRAALLGYPSHAHWRLADTMARTPEAAQTLMMKVWAAGIDQVRHDVAAMTGIAQSEGITGPIEPWDYLYLAEKRRKVLFDVDEAELTPYLDLDNIVAAALWAAGQLYGLHFREVTSHVSVFHEDVRVFEVTDGDGGPHRGLFYLDNFARPGKRSGAWASSYRLQQGLDGPVTPIVSNNNNFVRPAAGESALISIDDAVTLFHEFGHALHDLLQEVTHPWLSSPPWDFIELPSQLNEQWLLTEELLSRFARHYQTGEPMPQSLVDRVRRAEAFNQGYHTVETQAAAILDMVLHTRGDETFDPRAFEREELARIGMPREIALRHRLPHFDHLFGSDAYSAGYYSYLWADVMAADAWEAFLEAGPWNPELARRLRTHVLSNGNVTDRDEAYRLFRGRDPDEKALLRRRGLPVSSSSPPASSSPPSTAAPRRTPAP